MSYQAIPGQRLTISNARLVRLSSYEREGRTLWRHLFVTSQGPMVYTGAMLPVLSGQCVDIKGTVKRFEHFNGNELMRISRPKIIANFSQKKVDSLGLLL